MSYQELRATALEAERLGFDSLWLFDHLHGFPFPDHQSLLESWSTLSALSTTAKKIRLGTLVTNVHYRSPSMLAKTGATFDVISEGRLELGLGAGGTGRADWHRRLGYIPEYEAYGTSFSEKPSVRIGRLDEAINVIKLMWTEEQATFQGTYYRIQNAVCDPKPIQKPHPRIWIAGVGEKILLRVAARHANGTNFAWDLTPMDVRHKLSVLRRHCRILGRDYASITKSLSAGVLISDDEPQVNEMKRRLVERYREVEGYLPYPLRKGGIVGTPEQCLQQLKEFTDAGIQYFMLVFSDLEQMRFFGESVLPHYR